MKKNLTIILFLGLFLLVVVGARAATAPAAIPAGWEKINGAKYPTREAQRANYTNIFVANNALYGKPRTTAAVAKTKAKYNSQEDQAVLKAAADFVKNNLIEAGTKVDIIITDKYSGLYFLEITLGEGATARKIKSAITANKKFFLPQVMDMVEVAKTNQAANVRETATAAAAAVNLPQTDKPRLELFVMSHCPYGTQMEKGLLPVLEALGDQIDWQIKFVDYAMHGKKEVDEQLNQYCIEKEQTSKYPAYLKCFLQAADSVACLSQAGIDEAGLKICLAVSDSQYKITANYNDRNTWNGSFPPFDIYKADNDKYGVQGSPTLVINGQTVNGNRDSASLLATVCSAFTIRPAACSLSLSNQTPAPGFGSSTTTNTAPAGCGQ